MEEHKRDGDFKFIIFLFTERNKPKVGHRPADCDVGSWTEEADNKRNGNIL